MIEILNLEPTVISRDLRGKYILLYGKEKSGKTSLSAHFPKNLLLAAERGYNAIAGIKAQDITKWSDFKLVLRQLRDPKAKAMYDTITIDTVTLLWDMCETYICAQNGVQKIGEIGFGQGYGMCEKEFANALREITMLGYGLVCISHIKKTMVGEEEHQFEMVEPSMAKRCYTVVNRLVDIIAYLETEWDSEGVSHRYLYTRRTPSIMAGSRFPYLATKIPLGYEELANAIAEAIEKQKELDGATIVDNIAVKEEEVHDFEAFRAEAAAIWQQLVVDNQAENPELAAKNMDKIMGRVEKIFGRKMKISAITENQIDLFYLVILEMRDLQKEV